MKQEKPKPTARQNISLPPKVTVTETVEYEMDRGRRLHHIQTHRTPTRSRNLGRLTGAKVDVFIKMWRELVEHHGTATVSLAACGLKSPTSPIRKDEKSGKLYLTGANGERILAAWRKMKREQKMKGEAL